jgi:phosphatidate cytidylyltransferase
VIILAGFYEIFKLYRDSKYEQSGIFIIAVLIFILLSSGFFLYSGLNKEIIFYAFAILCIFDSFSNITGELWGRRKIMPKISPNKTITGFIGGFIVALISGIFFRKLISAPLLKAILLTAGLAFSAFIGDALSSYYKRIFKVKDFTNIIPEHGGFLDRFDSLIAGGAWTALYTITIF